MSDDQRDEPPRESFGTTAPDAPVTRVDFERAMRHLNLTDTRLRDTILQLAAQVVTLTDELTRRLDHVEPEPADPNTPARPPIGTIEAAVQAGLPEGLARVRAADEATAGRVSLDTGGDKYEAEISGPPCDELLHLCNARCCQFHFALSTQDLDEGIVRWDYGQPYLIRQRRSDRFCVHNEPTTHGCTVHAVRPRVCRVYDCTHDPRVWIDYERRIPAPPFEVQNYEYGDPTPFDLHQRAKQRALVIAAEESSVRETLADVAPVRGPAPKP